MIPFAALALLAATVPAAETWTVFVGPAGATGQVVQVAPDGSPAPIAALASIDLTEIDFVGRTQLERFLPSRPRREELPGGAAYLVLPNSRGTLYRYHRADAAGASHFGLFLIGAEGDLRILLELPATAEAAGNPPFPARIAAAPDGAAILVATAVESGGDLLEVDVASGAIENRTAALPPLAFGPHGFGLQPGWGLGVGSSGAVRFARTPGAQASALAFDSTPPAWLDGVAVFSGDGTTAAFIAGESPTAARVVTVAATGLARAATMPPQTLDGGGFLPEAIDGPWLALSWDGTWTGYRTREPKPTGGVSREVWLSSTSAGSPAPTHLTADANFLDTIDEVGLLRFEPSGALTFAAGEPNDGAPVGLDQIDLYRASPSGGGAATIVNVTKSSGDPAAPFTVPSSISPEDGVFLEPNSGSLILHDSESGGGRLLGVPAGGVDAVVLLDNVKAIDDVVWTGQRFVLAVRRDSEPKRRELIALSSSAAPSVLGAFPDDTVLSGLMPGPAGQVGLSIGLGPAEWIARVDPVNGPGEVLYPVPVGWELPLAWTADSSLRVALDPALAPGLYVEWTAAGALSAPPAPALAGMLLPAR